MNMATIMRGVKFATCVVAALAIAGCAKQQADPIAASAGTAAPGSQQDFVVNIGDRVFFETDSSELTSRAREALDKQSAMAQSLQPVRVYHRGARRRTRHARVQHCPWCPARPNRTRISRLA